MARRPGILNSNLIFVSIFFILLFCDTLGYESACMRCERNHQCKPPKCVCCGRDMPLPTKDVPQMVFFTFDDAVNTHIAGFYRQLFDSNRKNPNGCPISMTLFISHANTVYTLVREFYQKGMEIASHSVSHAHPSSKTFRNEARKQKENLARMARIPSSKIKGWRSPFLEPLGDAQPNTLQKLGYAYDATLTVGRGSRGTKAPKPFTLDYGWPYDCKIKPCPRRSHKGFWEVPVISIKDYLGKYECVYVDGCNNPPPDEESAFNFLWENFLTYYKGNRAPFGINMHAAWFYHQDRLKAMDRFIQELVKLDDVYVVSVKQVIAWLQNPTPLQDVASFEAWGCSQMNKNSSAFHLRNTKIQRRIHEIKQSNLKKQNEEHVRKHYEWKQKQNVRKHTSFSSHRKSNPGHYLQRSNIWQGLTQPGSSWSTIGSNRRQPKRSEFTWSSPAMSWQSLLAKYAQIQSKKAQERKPQLSQAQIAREKERSMKEQKRIKEQQRIAKQKRIEKEAAEIAKQRQKEEQAKLAESKRIAKEKKRIEEIRLATEKQKANERRLAEQRRLAEEKRLADERRMAEEKRKAEAERLIEEKRRAEERRIAEERRKTEQKRLAEERRKAEERLLSEQRRKAEERRLAEEKRKADEQRLAEERRLAEQRRILEEKRKKEAEVKRIAEEMRAAKERQRLAENEQRRKEEMRLKEQQRLNLEKKRLQEEKMKAEKAVREAELKRIAAEAAEYKRLLEETRNKEMNNLKPSHDSTLHHSSKLKESVKLLHFDKIKGYEKKEPTGGNLRQNASSNNKERKYKVKKTQSKKKHNRNLSVHLATSAEKQEVRLIGEPWRTWYSDSGLVEMKEPWKTWIMQKHIVKPVVKKPKPTTTFVAVPDTSTIPTTTEQPTTIASTTTTSSTAATTTKPTTKTEPTAMTSTIKTSTVPNTNIYISGLTAQITVEDSKNQVLLPNGLILPKAGSVKGTGNKQNIQEVTSSVTLTSTIPTTKVTTTTISPDICLQEQNCFRPNCVCKAERPPSGMSASKIPQIIYITIEGDINFLSYSKMRSIFTRYRKNPNGCRIRGTFFASDVGSNYRLASILRRDGIEIALNGMKATPYNNDQEINKDMSDHLKVITDHTGIVRNDVNGWRTPLMKPVGDGQFDALKQNSLYDSSLVSARSFTNDTKIWPFTLDFGWSEVCVKGDCPSKKHPAVWEVPVIPLVNIDNVTTCEYADDCTPLLSTSEKTENFLLKNFNNYYKKNRAPFGIHISQKWFYWINNRNLYGFSRFLDKVLKMDDVYVVSVSQMLDWVKQPVSLDNIRNFSEWKC